MLRALFGRGKRREQPAGRTQYGLRDATVGDVLVIPSLGLEFEDCYFVVEQRHRYEGGGMVWYELVATDGDRRVWVEWGEDGPGLFVTATDDRRAVGLESVGITESDVLDMDERRSIDRSIAVDGLRYMYRNSFEAYYFRDNRQSGGEGFWMWEFLAEDESRVMSVAKFEGSPFEVYSADIISAEDIQVYPGENAEQRSR